MREMKSMRDLLRWEIINECAQFQNKKATMNIIVRLRWRFATHLIWAYFEPIMSRKAEWILQLSNQLKTTDKVHAWMACCSPPPLKYGPINYRTAMQPVFAQPSCRGHIIPSRLSLARIALLGGLAGRIIVTARGILTAEEASHPFGKFVCHRSMREGQNNRGGGV